MNDARSRTWLPRTALALLLIGAVTLVAPTAGAQDDDDPAPNIEVVQTPGDGGQDCIDYTPGPLTKLPAEIQWSTSGLPLSSETFTLTIVLTAPLCDPLEVHAVIYGMPKGGGEWPQTLSEKETFTLEEAGTTVVTFTKECAPVQFDVLVGSTPESIAPWAAWHGPLLIPDVASSLQYFGNRPGCVPTTTTTTTTTPQVQGSTTLPGAPTSVASASTVAPGNTVAVLSSGSPTRAASLAFTGRTSGVTVALGVSLLAMGLLLSFLSRRSRASA